MASDDILPEPNSKAEPSAHQNISASPTTSQDGLPRVFLTLDMTIIKTNNSFDRLLGFSSVDFKDLRYFLYALEWRMIRHLREMLKSEQLEKTPAYYSPPTSDHEEQNTIIDHFEFSSAEKLGTGRSGMLIFQRCGFLMPLPVQFHLACTNSVYFVVLELYAPAPPPPQWSHRARMLSNAQAAYKQFGLPFPYETPRFDQFDSKSKSRLHIAARCGPCEKAGVWCDVVGRTCFQCRNGGKREWNACNCPLSEKREPPEVACQSSPTSPSGMMEPGPLTSAFKTAFGAQKEEGSNTGMEPHPVTQSQPMAQPLTNQEDDVRSAISPTETLHERLAGVYQRNTHDRPPSEADLPWVAAPRIPPDRDAAYRISDPTVTSVDYPSINKVSDTFVLQNIQEESVHSSSSSATSDDNLIPSGSSDSDRRSNLPSTEFVAGCLPSELLLSEILDPMLQLMIDRSMDKFWSIFDADGEAAFIKRCNDTSPAGSRNFHSTDDSSLPTTDTSRAQLKRQNDGEDPHDDQGRKRKTPSFATMLATRESPLTLACPFRKHNPRKYSVHTHRVCALNSWPSISRLKEHLFRAHKMPPHCVRCWQRFKEPKEVDAHLSVADANICSLQPGQPPDGITLEQVNHLKNMKKSANHSIEDQWRDIFRYLLPGQIMHTPHFELPEDEYPATPYWRSIAELEAYARDELPRMVRSHLEDIARTEMQIRECSLMRHLPEIIQGCQDMLFRNFRAACGLSGPPEQASGHSEEMTEPTSVSAQVACDDISPSDYLNDAFRSPPPVDQHEFQSSNFDSRNRPTLSLSVGDSSETSSSRPTDHERLPDDFGNTFQAWPGMSGSPRDVSASDGMENDQPRICFCMGLCSCNEASGAWSHAGEQRFPFTLGAEQGSDWMGDFDWLFADPTGFDQLNVPDEMKGKRKGKEREQGKDKGKGKARETDL